MTELWRARLEPDPQTPDVRPNLYAIWSRPGDPPRRSPGRCRRTTGRRSSPLRSPRRRSQVERLWLTSQGSFLDLSGEWPSTSARAAYLHRSTAGRDLHVEVTERGYLAPFGHPATITTVTERQFRPDANGEPTAILVQDDYLAVSGTDGDLPRSAHAGRGPSHPVPDGRRDRRRRRPGRARGDHPGATAPRSAPTTPGWSPATTLTPWSATPRPTGPGRNGITFTMPAIFVIERHAYTVQDEVNGVRTPLGNLNTYFDEAPASRVEPDLGGQLIGWADPHPRGTAGSDRVTEQHADHPGPPGPGRRDDPRPPSGPSWKPRDGRPSTRGSSTRRWSTRPRRRCWAATARRSQVRYAAAWLANGNEAGNPGLAFHTLVETTAVERSGIGAAVWSSRPSTSPPSARPWARAPS